MSEIKYYQKNIIQQGRTKWIKSYNKDISISNKCCSLELSAKKKKSITGFNIENDKKWIMWHWIMMLKIQLCIKKMKIKLKKIKTRKQLS